MDSEPLASVDEVADYLHVSKATVHAWLYRGTGPRSYKIGKHRRFRWADIREWMEAQADDPKDATDVAS